MKNLFSNVVFRSADIVQIWKFWPLSERERGKKPYHPSLDVPLFEFCRNLIIYTICRLRLQKIRGISIEQLKKQFYKEFRLTDFHQNLTVASLK